MAGEPMAAAASGGLHRANLIKPQVNRRINRDFFLTSALQYRANYLNTPVFALNTAFFGNNFCLHH